MSILIGTRN